MDIKILDSHLREYLDTKAKPAEISKYVSLCGPTFDRTKKVGSDWLYEIEVTTNRADAASVLGIAREAAAILPQFGIKAKLKKFSAPSFKFSNNGLPLTLKSNPKLVNRLTGVVIEGIKNWESPKWLAERLLASGMRSLNAVVDITNYVMLTVGHPSHAFDYDKIKNHTIAVRESKKGEKITSFDGKTHTLPGGDIVFEDVDGEIIDLPGIIGTKNSVVSKDTKRVLFFFDNNNPARIRKTSMNLGVRTMAATLNEKQVDPELVPTALSLGVNLFRTICEGQPASQVYDVYPKPYTVKTVITTKGFIEKILGIEIEKSKIDSLLKALAFKPKWAGGKLTVSIPSFRAHDINIEEDIVEEVARVYGYHNLPSKLMAGELPKPVVNTPFKFEDGLRQSLKALGAVETLTSSLVSRAMTGKDSLKVANPLGSDTEYLRTSLKPSLLAAIKQNSGIEAPYHLFEIANVYLPHRSIAKGGIPDLPKEKMVLAGIFVNYSYRAAKGVLEAGLEALSITADVHLEPKEENFYYESEVEKLKNSIKPRTYVPAPKYPPQIEDITIAVPEGKYVGDVIYSIKQASKLVWSVELVDIYERKFTFRIAYLHPDKTLSDKEVEKERERILQKLK